MEHYFRIALCMFLFVGYLQGKSLPVYQGDLGKLFHLSETVCGKTTFMSPSPSNETEECMALRIFACELKQMQKNCTDDRQYIGMTLGAMNKSEICPQVTSSPDCQWEGDGSRKQFAAFREDLKTLYQRISSRPN